MRLVLDVWRYDNQRLHDSSDRANGFCRRLRKVLYSRALTDNYISPRYENFHRIVWIMICNFDFVQIVSAPNGDKPLLVLECCISLAYTYDKMYQNVKPCIKACFISFPLLFSHAAISLIITEIQCIYLFANPLICIINIFDYIILLLCMHYSCNVRTRKIRAGENKTPQNDKPDNPEHRNHLSWLWIAECIRQEKNIFTQNISYAGIARSSTGIVWHLEVVTYISVTGSSISFAIACWHYSWCNFLIRPL